MFNFLFIVTCLLVAFPFVFRFTGGHNYENDASYKYIAVPAGMGARWVLGLLIFIKDDAYAMSKLDFAGYAQLLIGCVVVHYVLMFCKNNLFGNGGRESDNIDQHRRGQGLHNASEVVDMIKSRKEACRFAWGGVPIPAAVETVSFLLAGSPGTGKSQALQAMMDRAFKGDARGIVADPSASFLRRYKNAESVIFNPFDARSIDWSPFAEMNNAWDATTLSKSIIPDGEGSAAEWNGYAQGFVEALMLRLFEIDTPKMNATKAAFLDKQANLMQQAQGQADPKAAKILMQAADRIGEVLSLKANNGELFRLCCIADAELLREIVDGTPAQPLLVEANDRMFSSVRAIIGSYITPYRYLNPETGRDGYSIKKFVMDGKGWLFITYRQDQRAALTPLIGAVLDIASRAMLTTKPDLNRRFFFILDEFPLLGKVSSIVELLSNGRKHGASVLIGIQTIAQLQATYSQKVAQTILSCLGTWMVLRCNDNETAAYMAHHVGKEEVLRTNESEGTSGDGNKTANKSLAVVVQDVLLPSEIQNWPNLQGVLNIAGDYPVCPIVLQIVEAMAERCEDFVEVQQREYQANVAHPMMNPLSTDGMLTSNPEAPSPAASTAGWNFE